MSEDKTRKAAVEPSLPRLVGRSIRFRAWDTLNNCWEENLTINADGKFVQRWYEGTNRELIGSFDNLPIERFCLVQFTGLHDKNNKEIYEGDILASDCNEKPCNYIVKWGENRGEYCGFVLNPVMKNPPSVTFHIHDFKMWMAEGFSVIGNIFENPELLAQLFD